MFSRAGDLDRLAGQAHIWTAQQNTQAETQNGRTGVGGTPIPDRPWCGKSDRTRVQRAS